MITAIPTLYKGVRFRSRLEARWAAFFDLLKWQTFYEPFELNGWIPDFILHGVKERVAIEVKPIISMDDPLFLETITKIGRSGWEHDVLIVSYFWPEGELGWLGQTMLDVIGDVAAYAKDNRDDPDPFRDWGLTNWQSVATGHDAVVGFCHSTQSFTDRVTGYYPGGQTGANDPDKIEQLWAAAGNAVQWRGV